ncbi:MAG: CDGSH iron-sulfur domain-containing protein [Rubrivivax sp.]|nr:CDGSH iron-sulfur domain-containing protein [Rubrivivax sp.]
MSDLPRIECIPNGPLKVQGLTTLRNARGEALPVEPSTFLCRCGGSARKPYCDGTHRRNGFASAKSPERTPERVDHYRGRQVTIHDNRGLCAHAGRCTDGLPATFRHGQEPFIDADADADAVARICEVVASCPSGALSVTVHDAASAPPAAPPRPPGIVVTPGPYAVVGGIAIDQPQGAGASAEHYTLCRCGASKNKPFCDGSHWAVGFKDEPAAGTPA